MKKLAFLLFGALALNVSSQSTIQLTNSVTAAVIQPNSVITMTASFGTTKKITVDVKNTSNTQKTYNAKRYDLLLNSSISSTDTSYAKAYFCFGGLCYGEDTYVSPNPIVLSAGKSASDTTADFYMLVAYFDEATKKGCSMVKYTFYDVNNVSDSVQFAVNYNCTVTGINEMTRSEKMEIYPNPANQHAFIKISSNENFESNVMLFNSLGKLVSQQPISVKEGRNQVNLEIAELPAGIYFISIKKGDASLTRKLIIE